ncbi:peptidoglycan-binding domain-containing protein [Streptomyces sp. NPDC005408]|uniref:peptidoglycan-binding domain-containing protein n=1 Tax=Streptomyces sp. NPDC005408 TaxID=3155341 RepID=UPI0033BF5B6E
MRRIVLGALAAAASMFLLAGTANAVPGNSGVYGTTFVDGAGALTDDFGDHYSELGHSLCNGCADTRNTDLVLMWQSILVAEGLLPASGIDGSFGPNTASATVNWQKRYGIPADGRVGNQTWSRADDRLVWQFTGDYYEVYYRASGAGGVYFIRGDENSQDDGAYQLTAVQLPNLSYNFFHGGPRIQYYQRTVLEG